MLKDIRKSCVHYASLLGDYQALTCDELANGYCSAIDNKNRNDQSKYLSALVLRFWYTIDKLYQKCPGIGLTHEDFYAWLVESINYACNYRAWQDDAKHVNAQQAINQCIETIRRQHYYGFNLDKHRANYNSTSLDNPEDEDQTVTVLDTMAGTDYSDTESSLNAESLVQACINDKKIIQAIILDNIAFNDVEKHTKIKAKEVDADGVTHKYVRYSHEFWDYKLVQVLGNLPDNYKNYFTSKYSIVTTELDACLAAIKKANNQKLYKYLKECKTYARQVIEAAM